MAKKIVSAIMFLATSEAQDNTAVLVKTTPIGVVDFLDSINFCYLTECCHRFRLRCGDQKMYWILNVYAIFLAIFFKTRFCLKLLAFSIYGTLWRTPLIWTAGTYSLFRQEWTKVETGAKTWWRWRPKYRNFNGKTPESNRKCSNLNPI